MECLTITQYNAADVTVLELEGRIVLPVYQRVTELVRGLIKQGRTKLVLGCSGITYTDSAGKGFLVSAYAAARNSGGRLLLAVPSPRFLDSLQGTKLLTAFDVFATIPEALAFFGLGEHEPREQSEKIVHNFDYE